MKVIIVGAGLSGLAVAYELTLQGHAVRLYEASNRAGGRVLTIREPFAARQYAEAGAEGIPANHEFTLHYIKHFNLTVDAVGDSSLSPSSIWLHIKGQTIRLAEIRDDPSKIPYELTPAEQEGFPFLLLSAYTDRHKQSFLSRLRAPFLDELRYLDRMPLIDYLRKSGVSSDLLTVLANCPYPVYPVDRISAFHALWQEATYDPTAPIFRVRGGIDQLTMAFCRRLGPCVRYRSRVDAVEQHRHGVRVHVASPEGPLTDSGDVCVLAVPIPAIMQMAVDLPPHLRLVLSGVRYASLLKCHLQFRRRLWEEAGWCGIAWTDLPIGYVWNASAGQAGTHGILTCFLRGDRARCFLAAKTEGVPEVCRYLARILPGLDHAFEAAFWKSWDHEPWIGGAVPYVEAGNAFRYFHTITHPWSRVCFAGDHTSGWPGWMNGAFESADRVLCDISGRGIEPLLQDARTANETHS
jgi:monoamine oxidase